MTREVRLLAVRLALALSAVTLGCGVSGEVLAEVGVEATGAPADEVPASEMPGLPRYPGSICVEYGIEVIDGLATTRAQYAVVAELDGVREFYRQVFQAGGWSEVDVRVSRDEWTFLVVSGLREARIRLEDRGELVEIAIGLSEPVVTTTRSGLTMLAAASSMSARPGPDRSGSRHL